MKIYKKIIITASLLLTVGCTKEALNDNSNNINYTNKYECVRNENIKKYLVDKRNGKNHFTSIEEENTLRETSPIAIEERFYKTYNFNEDGSKLLNQIERETFTYLLDYDMDKELDFYKTKCDGVEEYGYINCKVSLKDKVITITKELDLTSDKVSDELKNKTLAIIKNDYFEDEVYTCS